VTPEQLRDLVRTVVAAVVERGTLAVAVPDEVLVERPEEPRARRLRDQRRPPPGQAGRHAAARGRRPARRGAARAAGRRAGRRRRPGFLNVTLAQGALGRIAVDRSRRPRLRHTGPSPGSRLNLEFVSPTRQARVHIGGTAGPQWVTPSAGCWRPAAVTVTREYYFNDAGAQNAGCPLPDGRRSRPAGPEDGYAGGTTTARSPAQVVAPKPAVPERPT
jgi:arginyl-tRNA synthetase